MTKVAFEQDEVFERKGRTRQTGVVGEEARNLRLGGGVARHASKGNVRQVGAPLGLEPGANECAIDFAVERRERVMRRHARPYRIGSALAIEGTDPRQGHLGGGAMNLRQGRDDVLCHRPVNRADETQRQVKLIVVLPARARNARHHGR